MRTIVFTILLFTTLTASAQTGDGTKALSPSSISKFLGSISSKCSSLQDGLTQKTEQYLIKLEKQEDKLYKKLWKKDSVAAKKLFADRQSRYAAMKARLNSAGTSGKKLKEYIPHFDTLKTSLAFLEKGMGSSPQLAKAKEQLQAFESRMQVANEIKKQIRERKQQLNEQLKGFGMGRQLMAFNKQSYYYQQQLNEYKAMFSDPKRMEQKAVSLLEKSSLFRNFMARNSLLAQLFKLPDGYGSPASLANLQTVASVQQQLSARVSTGGPNAQQLMQQQVQEGQNKLQALKAQANKLGGANSSNMDMPDFKPNNQKTKSFLKRIEYGLSFQAQKTKGILPTTTDIALSAGYKLNDKSTIGMAAGYKMGWGSDIRHIRISHQGISLRSFIDIKLKGSFWLSGGYELNHQKAFVSFRELYGVDAWQRSGLVGLTKKYKIGKKENNVQLLWDFLSYQQVPRTEALKFRIGYKL